jgi:hypothetical protein
MKRERLGMMSKYGLYPFGRQTIPLVLIEESILWSLRRIIRMKILDLLLLIARREKGR